MLDSASFLVKRFKFESYIIFNIETSVEKEKQEHYDVVEH
jgi:hypothetical protein